MVLENVWLFGCYVCCMTHCFPCRQSEHWFVQLSTKATHSFISAFWAHGRLVDIAFFFLAYKRRRSSLRLLQLVYQTDAQNCLWSNTFSGNNTLLHDIIRLKKASSLENVFGFLRLLTLLYRRVGGGGGSLYIVCMQKTTAHTCSFNKQTNVIPGFFLFC